MKTKQLRAWVDRLIEIKCEIQKLPDGPENDQGMNYLIGYIESYEILTGKAVDNHVDRV